MSGERLTYRDFIRFVESLERAAAALEIAPDE